MIPTIGKNKIHVPNHQRDNFTTSMKAINVGKTLIHHHIFDGLYHPFMVILGMVYYCFQ